MNSIIKFFGVFFSLVGLVCGLSIFHIGFHNFDYSRNIMHFLYRTGKPFYYYEKWSERLIGSNKTINLEDAYNSGLYYIFLGLFISIFSSFVLGLWLAYLILERSLYQKSTETKTLTKRNTKPEK